MDSKFKVNDAVVVMYPKGNTFGHIKEVKYGGVYDVDFGGGCTGHDINEDMIVRYSITEVYKELVKDLNPNEHKISIPLPEDAKWEAIGRGYASVLMEKQARIDRLERMIFILYENICKDVKSNMPYDNDVETTLFSEILEKVEQLKNK